MSARVLWSGPMAGRSTFVITITLPGGAQVIEAVSKEPLNDRSQGSSGTEFLADAGPLKDLGVAFALEPLGYRGDHPPVASIGLIGPRTATTAVVVDSKGGRHEVALVDGIGTSPVTDAVSVKFRTAAGRTLTTARVAGLNQRLPGPPP
jgi:hypothetical protein